MLYAKIKASTKFINHEIGRSADIGIVLGSGLSGFVDHLTDVEAIPYADIPHFPLATAPGHKGELVFATLAGVSVMVLSGRFHYYEGYHMAQATFPIRVLKSLGAEKLILTNVSGSVQPSIQAGDIVLLKDHINLMPDNPLRGPNDDQIGPRFLDMSQAYDPSFRSLAMNFAQAKKLPIHEGVYLALPGPNLETPAEYRMANLLGADIVGMSTVPEVLVARHENMQVGVLSLVSNHCYPVPQATPTTIEEILQIANEGAPRMTTIINYLVHQW